ncbi:MAG: SGNH/GDSL hydrolase family protein [Clostridiales bacterium]|nr:SGNH/GDSL hydrolase family protein [Clostridiales bacterium]
MKKRLAALLAAVMLLVCSCAGQSSSSSAPSSAASDGGTSQTGQLPRQLELEEMKNLITEKAGAQGLTDAMLAEGLSPTGNHGRIAAAIRKSLAGEPVTLGVIGGSITEGTASSAAENSYAGQFKTWWETLFPGGEVTLVNAGKGATGSLIGAHRVEEDLLAHQPDVVIVEYAVNDGNGERDQMAYESLLRRILKAENQPGVLLLFTMKEDGTSVQRNQSKIGQHYDVPMVSYRNAVYPAVEDGRIPWTEISPDGIHPNDKGHAMIGVLLANYLVSVYEKLDSLSADGYVLPEPLVGDAYENGILYTNKNLEELQAGSFMRQVNSFYQFPYGWKAVGGSEAIEFEIPECRELYLLTLRLDDPNAGIAEVTVEGETVKTTELQQNYPGLTYQYADPLLVYTGENPGTVRVTVRLKATADTDYFTLLGFLAS